MDRPFPGRERPSSAWVARLVFCAVLVLGLSGCDRTEDPIARVPEGAASKPFPRPFQIIAHRGASAYAPENTLPAFRIARELGAFEVELDVQLSADDVVMLYHDDTLEEKVGRAGVVRDYTSAELQKMEIGTWFDETHPAVGESFAGVPVNTLDQLFDAFGPELYYHIELKSSDPGLPGRVLESVDRAELRQRARVTSFDVDQLKRSIALAPDLPHTLLIRDAAFLRDESDGDGERLSILQQRKVDLAVGEGFDQVGIAAEDLNPEIIAYVNVVGISLRAWRIKSDADMARAVEMGTSGMTTNWPDRLIRSLVEHMGSGGQD